VHILVGDDTERLTLRLREVFVRNGGSPICSKGAVNTPDRKSWLSDSSSIFGGLLGRSSVSSSGLYWADNTDFRRVTEALLDGTSPSADSESTPCFESHLLYSFGAISG